MCKREIKCLKEDSQVKIKNMIIEQRKMMETLSFNIKEIKEQLQEKEIQIIQLIDEGNCFKEELRKKDKEIEEQKRKLEVVVNDGNIQRENMMTIINKMEEESNLRERQVTEKINELKRSEINHLAEDLKIKEEMESLKKESKKYQEKTDSTLTNLKEENNKKYEMSQNNVNQSVEESKKRIDSLTERINVLYLKTNVIIGEILYRVDKYIERNNPKEVLYSPYFYSHFNGYKLKLSVYPRDYNGTYLSIFFAVCKGDYDDGLLWPCKHSITLSVLNQCNGSDYKSVTFSISNATNKQGFNKPINIENVPAYCYEIPLGDIQSIITNNAVLIKCRVTAPS